MMLPAIVSTSFVFSCNFAMASVTEWLVSLIMADCCFKDSIAAMFLRMLSLESSAICTICSEI